MWVFIHLRVDSETNLKLCYTQSDWNYKRLPKYSKIRYGTVPHIDFEFFGPGIKLITNNFAHQFYLTTISFYDFQILESKKWYNKTKFIILGFKMSNFTFFSQFRFDNSPTNSMQPYPSHLYERRLYCQDANLWRHQRLCRWLWRGRLQIHARLRAQRVQVSQQQMYPEDVAVRWRGRLQRRFRRNKLHTTTSRCTLPVRRIQV
jgi:hypothetical protein